MGAGTNSCSLKVMTYNIEMKKEDAWGGRNLSSTIASIVNATPDVVGLQEDDSNWRDSGEYSALTANGYTQVKFSGNGSENLDIFYRADKFTLIESGQKFFKKLAEGDYSNVDPKGADLSIDTSGDKEYGWSYITGRDKGRMFSYVVLQDKNSGAVVLIVNTHLHYGDGTGSAEKYVDDNLVRDYQASLLNAWLDDMAAQYPNQIVMGDMNATPTTSTIKALSDGLQSARDSARLKGDIGGTLCSTSDYVRRDEYVFDHVFYRNVTASYYSVINNIIDEVDGTLRYPSDHLPVVTQFICSAE